MWICSTPASAQTHTCSAPTGRGKHSLQRCTGETVTMNLFSKRGEENTVSLSKHRCLWCQEPPLLLPRRRWKKKTKKKTLSAWMQQATESCAAAGPAGQPLGSGAYRSIPVSWFCFASAHDWRGVSPLPLKAWGRCQALALPPFWWFLPVFQYFLCKD